MSAEAEVQTVDSGFRRNDGKMTKITNEAN